jgi:polyvinyl alcohol dehydrogenase (cytochrome)
MSRRRKVIVGVFLLAVLAAAIVTLNAPAKQALLDVPMPPQAFCAGDHPAFDNPFAGPHWNGWGVDLNNRRSQPDSMAGLPGEQVQRLKLKWAFGVPGASGMFAQPTVIGGRLFFGTSVGKVYSIDAASGCIYWSFETGALVRTAITIGPAGDRWAAYFGDNGARGAHAYAVDAGTGRLIWTSPALPFWRRASFMCR